MSKTWEKERDKAPYTVRAFPSNQNAAVNDLSRVAFRWKSLDSMLRAELRLIK